VAETRKELGEVLRKGARVEVRVLRTSPRKGMEGRWDTEAEEGE
jgi:hypothetical protein